MIKKLSQLNETSIINLLEPQHKDSILCRETVFIRRSFLDYLLLGGLSSFLECPLWEVIYQLPDLWPQSMKGDEFNFYISMSMKYLILC